MLPLSALATQTLFLSMVVFTIFQRPIMASAYALPSPEKSVTNHLSDLICIYSGKIFMTSLTKLNMPLTNFHNIVHFYAAELVTVAILFCGYLNFVLRLFKF